MEHLKNMVAKLEFFLPSLKEFSIFFDASICSNFELVLFQPILVGFSIISVPLLYKIPPTTNICISISCMNEPFIKNYNMEAKTLDNKFSNYNSNFSW